MAKSGIILLFLCHSIIIICNFMYSCIFGFRFCSQCVSGTINVTNECHHTAGTNMTVLLFERKSDVPVFDTYMDNGKGGGGGG